MMRGMVGEDDENEDVPAYIKEPEGTMRLEEA